MKELRLTCSLLFALCLTPAVRADLYYFRPVNSYSWDDPANWLEGSGTSVNRLPGDADIVTLNSSLISTQSGHALAVTSGTSAVCARLRLHDQNAYPQSNIWVRVETGGSLTCAAAGDEGNASIQVGGSYPGMLILDGGAVTSRHAIAGLWANGSGIISNNAGIWMNDYVISGNNGTGLIVNAGTFRTEHLVIGRRTGAFGRVVQNDGPFFSSGQFVVGSAGTGVFEANASFNATILSLGTAGGPGFVVVNGGATGTVSDICNVGGRDGVATGGGGVLWLKGGALRFDDGYLKEKFFVRRDAGASGQLRGWGAVVPRVNYENTIRMTCDGTVVADGEGTERDLDLRQVVSVTNRFGNAEGTNGWYAVNKGRVRFPRTWFLEANTARCLGDCPYNTVLVLVNSVRATFTGVDISDSSYFRGEFYASDRADIPGGLPADARPVGVWNLGLYADMLNPSPRTFTDAALTFRYDQTQVKPADKLKLYRYENDGWILVKAALPDGTGLISTDSPLRRLTSGVPNIGWFALVAVEQTGTLISIQ